MGYFSGKLLSRFQTNAILRDDFQWNVLAPLLWFTLLFTSIVVRWVCLVWYECMIFHAVFPDKVSALIHITPVNHYVLHMLWLSLQKISWVKKVMSISAGDVSANVMQPELPCKSKQIANLNSDAMGTVINSALYGPACPQSSFCGKVWWVIHLCECQHIPGNMPTLFHYWGKGHTAFFLPLHPLLWCGMQKES